MNAIASLSDAQHPNAYGGGSPPVESEFFCHCWGNVQNSSSNEGASIVESKDERATIPQVGDFDTAGKGECLVSSFHGRGLKSFSQCGLARKQPIAFTVIRSDSILNMADSSSGVQRLVADAPDYIRSVFVSAVIAAGSARTEATNQCEGKK